MNNIIIISWPTNFNDEIGIINQLFECGLKQFHIRKPDFNSLEMRSYINAIPNKYKRFLVLHSHFHLAKEMDLMGIQVGVNRVEEAKEYINIFDYFGYSAHSFLEIEENKGIYSHFFLSPIFNSISKSNYKAKYSHDDLRVFLKDNNTNIAALGGIELNNYGLCLDLGFDSIALLGTIWTHKNPVIAFPELCCLPAVNKNHIK